MLGEFDNFSYRFLLAYAYVGKLKIFVVKNYIIIFKAKKKDIFCLLHVPKVRNF